MNKEGFDSYRRKRKGNRLQNNVILVVCGGKTELIYFKKFNIDLGEIRVKPVPEGRNPLNVVKRAIQESQRALYRQIWCVFDKDNFSDYDDAIKLAEKNHIKVAYSNQAFEFWFILHFQKLNAALNRKLYKQILKDCLGREYNKTDDKIYSLLKRRIKKAIEHAKWGHQAHKRNGGKPSDWESCTTVYKLAEELLRWKR